MYNQGFMVNFAKVIGQMENIEEWSNGGDAQMAGKLLSEKAPQTHLDEVCRPRLLAS